jgi:1-aminocyclopropane-1-carboxylate deaminase/D-cysteine desulfhydrase-like pyridoxal-dependent ACC family enzyme
MTVRQAPLSADELRSRIDPLPRQRMAVLPTGLQEMPHLSSLAGLDRFFVKRDDLTGIALGGNKSRAMEFILGEAVDQGCDVIIAGGGAEQSNHGVQCVASANRLGLDAVIVLQRRPDARPNGNALLLEVLGGRPIWIDTDPNLQDRTSASRHMHSVADSLRSQGRRPYVLESSLHPLSVVAYVAACLELLQQLPEPDQPLRIYITSEGAALGGLLLGSKLLGLPWEVVGLDWRPQQPDTNQRLVELIELAAGRLGVPNPVRLADLDVRDTGGPSYGVGNSDSWAALRTAARLEGLILDPVYSAKGMAGALADLQQHGAPTGGRAVFVHTGGVAALFAYEGELRRRVIDETTEASPPLQPSGSPGSSADPAAPHPIRGTERTTS